METVEARHDALFYRDWDDYAAGIAAFLDPAMRAGSPALVAVPTATVEVLREWLVSSAGEASLEHVQFADITALGGNPARLMPAIQEFIDDHPQASRVSLVGEPIWAGRTPAEVCEATRHEALLNTVFGAAAVDILCLYAAGELDQATIDDASRTHPTVIDADGRRVSATFADPPTMYDPSDPLSPVPAGAVVLAVDAGSLESLRHVVRQRALDLGLAPDRATDLVLAANEIATNTVMHTDGPGVLRLWAEDGRVLCEVSDSGRLHDPLAGRLRPPDDSTGGRGLYMANVLCDLVQWRCDADGTTVRLQLR